MTLRRKKHSIRPRGAPMFGAIPQDQPDSTPKDPDTAMDIARYLADEIKKRWPDAEIPLQLAGKHKSLNAKLLEEYPSSTIRSMIQVLVWDFDVIKHNKTFFPPSTHLTFPWLDQLYSYRFALAGAIGKGLTDSTSRVSLYVQRYLSGKEEPLLTEKRPEKENMKDIAKRLLGN